MGTRSDKLKNELFGIAIFLIALMVILFQDPGIIPSAIRAAAAGLITFIGLFFVMKTPMWIAIAVLIVIIIVGYSYQRGNKEEPAPSETDEVSS